MSMPYSTSQLPISHRRGGPPPLFAFGHGLTYTHFRHADFSFPAQVLTSDECLTISWIVRNSGGREGCAIPQVYVKDGDRAELIGFAKVHLASGASARVSIRLWLEQFARRESGGARRITATSVRLMIGSSASDAHATATVEIVGPDRLSLDASRLFSQTRVDAVSNRINPLP